MSLPGRLAGQPLRTVLLAIAVITALTGLAEIVAGGPVLGLLGAEATPAARQLFGTVGMFMLVVGGLLTHSLLRPEPSADVVLWAGLQKAGATAAVTVGVLTGVFAPVALAVAGFDLATAVLLGLYWRRLRDPGRPGSTPAGSNSTRTPGPRTRSARP